MPIDEPDIRIVMSDGVSVAVRIYRPDGPGPFPTLFAASPYRYDNDDLPPSKVFFWLETGPIRWYVDQGYAYVHLDTRGTGKSGGTYGLMDRRERRDLYEVIEWIAEQDWSNGRVGGIGMSYYSAAQWMMLSERPPHLACAAPYDGHYDPYRGWAYPGGVVSTFMGYWWNSSVRIANKYPANGSEPRDLDIDIPALTLAHPELDGFWEERSFESALVGVDIPTYSIGTWAKRELHLGGNLRAFGLLGGPKKLKLLDLPSGAAALELFENVEFHREHLLPFYDHYLKGLDTDYQQRPQVEYTLAGSGETYSAAQWPPKEVGYTSMYLSAETSGSVTSINDGSLTPDVPPDEAIAAYDYPKPEWLFGPVVMTPRGPDTVRETLTFTSAPLTEDVDMVGPVELVAYLSSTRDDTRIIARLSEQFPRSDEERSAGFQPTSTVVTKGWLRAAHRALDDDESRPGEPRHLHTRVDPLIPGEPAELRIALIGCGHHFTKGSRIRLELSCGDTQFTDGQFAHSFTPDMVGTDSIHLGSLHPSRLLLPLRGRISVEARSPERPDR